MHGICRDQFYIAFLWKWLTTTTHSYLRYEHNYLRILARVELFFFSAVDYLLTGNPSIKTTNENKRPHVDTTHTKFTSKICSFCIENLVLFTSDVRTNVADAWHEYFFWFLLEIFGSKAVVLWQHNIIVQLNHLLAWYKINWRDFKPFQTKNHIR